MRTIADVLSTITPPKGKLPVIFNGHEPRYIGFASSYDEADNCAIRHRVSATYVSRAMLDTTKQKFFILHS